MNRYKLPPDLPLILPCFTQLMSQFCLTSAGIGDLSSRPRGTVSRCNGRGTTRETERSTMLTSNSSRQKTLSHKEPFGKRAATAPSRHTKMSYPFGNIFEISKTAERVVEEARRSKDSDKPFFLTEVQDAPDGELEMLRALVVEVTSSNSISTLLFIACGIQLRDVNKTLQWRVNSLSDQVHASFFQWFTAHDHARTCDAHRSTNKMRKLKT